MFAGGGAHGARIVGSPGSQRAASYILTGTSAVFDSGPAVCSRHDDGSDSGSSGYSSASSLSGGAISVSCDGPFWLLVTMYGILASDAEMMSTGFRGEPDVCLAVA